MSEYKIVNGRLQAWIMISGLGIAVYAFGYGEYLSVLSCLFCLATFWVVYRESQDLMDPRAMFFVATLVFVAIPSVGILASPQMVRNDFYTSETRGVLLSMSDFVFMQAVIFVGLISASVPLLVQGGGRVRPPRSRPGPERMAPRSIWILYTASVVALIGFLFASFGTLQRAIVLATDPVAREQSEATVLGGLYAFLYMLAIASSFYASSRLRSRLLRVGLFVLPILGIFPQANRGLILIGVAVAAASAMELRRRRAHLLVLVPILMLPLVSILFLSFRNMAMGGADISVERIIYNYLRENNMVATGSYVLNKLMTGDINYVYGMDVGLIALQFVPRILWPDKPMPLDYRLNEQLGMNHGLAYGTPLSIYGGAFINFTPYLYFVFMSAFIFIISRYYKKFQSDKLLIVFMSMFIVDIVRVGDIAREVLVFAIALGSTMFVRYYMSKTDFKSGI